MTTTNEFDSCSLSLTFVFGHHEFSYASLKYNTNKATQVVNQLEATEILIKLVWCHLLYEVNDGRFESGS